MAQLIKPLHSTADIRRTSIDTHLSRRSFVLRTVQAGALAAFGPGLDFSEADSSGTFEGGTFLGELDFLLEPELQLGHLEGSGLDGRREVDLSALEKGRMITPTGKFFVRTAVPDLLDLNQLRSLQVDGLVEQEVKGHELDGDRAVLR